MRNFHKFSWNRKWNPIAWQGANWNFSAGVNGFPRFVSQCCRILGNWHVPSQNNERFIRSSFNNTEWIIRCCCQRSRWCGRVDQQNWWLVVLNRLFFWEITIVRWGWSEWVCGLEWRFSCWIVGRRRVTIEYCYWRGRDWRNCGWFKSKSCYESFDACEVASTRKTWNFALECYSCCVASESCREVDVHLVCSIEGILDIARPKKSSRWDLWNSSRTATSVDGDTTDIGLSEVHSKIERFAAVWFGPYGLSAGIVSIQMPLRVELTGQESLPLRSKYYPNQSAKTF